MGKEAVGEILSSGGLGEEEGAFSYFAQPNAVAKEVVSGVCGVVVQRAAVDR